MFKDQIWKIYDDDSEEMIWENSLHSDMFGNDEEPDSEYKWEIPEKSIFKVLPLILLKLNFKFKKA